MTWPRDPPTCRHSSRCLREMPARRRRARFSTSAPRLRSYAWSWSPVRRTWLMWLEGGRLIYFDPVRNAPLLTDIEERCARRSEKAARLREQEARLQEREARREAEAERDLQATALRAAEARITELERRLRSKQRNGLLTGRRIRFARRLLECASTNVPGEGFAGRSCAHRRRSIEEAEVGRRSGPPPLWSHWGLCRIACQL